MPGLLSELKVRVPNFPFRFFFNVYVCMTVCHICVARGQKSVSNPLELELQWLWADCQGCWELNLDSLEKQQVLLTTESSLQTEGHHLYWATSLQNVYQDSLHERYVNDLHTCCKHSHLGFCFKHSQIYVKF